MYNPKPFKMRYSKNYLYILFCFFILVYFSRLAYVRNLYVIPDVSCYYSLDGDALQAVEDPKYKPGDNPIFFLDTSCRGDIDFRQACSIESAARLHPNFQINLLFTSPVTEETLKNSSLTKLLLYHNVKLARLHIDQYCKDTSVELILPMLNESLYPIKHSSEILRILTLHKFGGIYLDTDMIVVKNLDALPPNWIGKRAGGITLGIDAMALSKEPDGFDITNPILVVINDTYNTESCRTSALEAIEAIVNKSCPNVFQIDEPMYCAGVEVLLADSFYPVYEMEVDWYFEDGTIDFDDGSYMHHIPIHLSRHFKIKNNSRYAKLAKKFCPTIYEMHVDRFGK